MRGSAIRALRARFGWTQVQLAARLGTDAVTVSRWERGISRPRPSAIGRLQALGRPWGRSVEALTDVLGPERSARVLRQALLLERGPRPSRFAGSPRARLREVERARREQLALKAGPAP